MLDTSSAKHWLVTLDPREIVYALLATFVAGVAALWLGAFRRVRRLFVLRRSVRAYRKSLRQLCSSVIVIGRRQGFQMKDVYVELDLAVSDLAPDRGERVPYGLSESCVIVAGPGAGKSTIVKHKILEKLDHESALPFLIRLREYTPDKSIEEYLVAQLDLHGVPDSKPFVARNLSHRDSLCVLDGLDEVRPNLAQSVYDRINSFYSQFYRERPGALIVTCRKEAYRALPLSMQRIFEVRPLTDEQIRRFAEKWPLRYPDGKKSDTFLADLFATPRIHELARSPLLLVGGLMQYTESNLGVPEERVQYLARVGQWLVSDWAAAQEHPPDKYRAVYTRILAQLAFHMHRSERSELPTSEAVRVIASLLPGYGFQQVEANDVLASIKTKTGILVGDLPEAIVFSQFGLQEYYASTEVLDRISEDDLLRFANEGWWREVILLAIAQEKEPAAYLTKLFKGNPLLAAEAVAECPTPSLDFQGRAIDACIQAIDDQVLAARGATVPLIRKIRDVEEERLVSALEARLSGASTAKTAGLILAVAGTSAATTALSRHPSVWATCMQEAGYLSSSFENLLVGLIETGDDAQSRHAASLLSGRLSSDRFRQLIGLLPTLTASKAETVASMLLGDIADRSGQRYGEWATLTPEVSACTARISDPIAWAQKHLKSRQFRGYGAPAELILAAVAFKHSKTDCDDRTLRRVLSNSGIWAESGGQLMVWVASTLVVASFSKAF